ncbi:PUA-like domain-containing protein [Nemania serpens]|nr:PUA-like domain-containing protein [Nemania serpens]
MPKRKAAQLETETEPSLLRRSTRRKLPTSTPDATANENAGRSSATPAKSQSKPKTRTPQKSDKAKQTTQKAAASTKAAKPAKSSETDGDDDTSKSSDRWYWLMKAEPGSRFENGVDVKFSIDDLASRKDPEPWDGIRAYAARNNLRSMKTGELAFFYHSNCKEPGLVGTMEIVQEHSPDLSAHDPKAPYYDASSKLEDPKWSVVHVRFRSKFARPIGLKELREMGKPGQPLENMQMLKQSRLSVSRVSPSEWEYLIDLAQRQDDEVSNST